MIRLIGILLLVITCCLASPTKHKHSKSDVSNGLKKLSYNLKESVKEESHELESNSSSSENQSAKQTILVTRIRSNLTKSTNVTGSKADTLYKMANSLLQKEKNWLQTEKWLIDNIYRLRNELGDLKRELNDQKRLNSLLNQRTSNGQFNSDQIKSINIFQELTSLKVDFGLFSQQQQHIIQTIKDNQQYLNMQTDQLKQLTTMVKEQFKNIVSISQSIFNLQQIKDKTVYELKSEK